MRDLFKLQKEHFATASICALLVGIGAVAGIGIDLFWVIMDAMHSFKWYHTAVAFGLTFALVITIWSFIYLIKSIHTFEKEHDMSVDKLHSWNPKSDELHKPVGQVEYQPNDRDDS